MNFSIRKQPALLTASVLGLTLAVTACANTNNQTPDAVKPMMLKDGSGMNQQHGDRMMQRDGAGMNQRDDRMMGKMGKDEMGRKMAMLDLPPRSKFKCNSCMLSIKHKYNNSASKCNSLMPISLHRNKPVQAQLPC